MAGDTFEAYWGEFLVSPAPLELSFNYCSHSCHYCFANLNKPERKSDIKATLRLLHNYHSRKTYKAILLQQNYPVLISNRVDPFAVSNYRQALPITELMARMEIPMMLQTKGGRGIDDALSFLPLSCWYISIAHNDDDSRQRIEPGAPTIESRFDLIEKLRSQDHEVVVGINPCVPEWLPRPKELCDRLVGLGVHGVWLEMLHLNRNQRKRLTGTRGYDAIGEGIISRMKGRCPDDKDSDFLEHVRDLAQLSGLEVFSMHQSTHSNFWEPYHRLYPKRFPLLQDWINHLHETKSTGGLVYFNEFAEWALPQLPEGRIKIGHYIGAIAHQIPREMGENWNNWMTFRDLLAMLWADSRISTAIVNCEGLSAASSDGTIDTLYLDDEGRPVLAWNPEGWSNYIVEV